VKALLDTCVVAEARNPKGSAAVKAALRRADDGDLYLSALTVGEIAKGVALLPAGKKKRELAAWLAGLEAQFADRILSPSTARRPWSGVRSRPGKAHEHRSSCIE
jgi:toxin FitB